MGLDITMLCEAIGNFGFPVFCCITLGWYILKRQDASEKRLNDELDKQNKRIDKMFDKLNDTMLKVSNSLSENTKVLEECKAFFTESKVNNENDSKRDN